MFTGLVEDLGEIAAVTPLAAGAGLTLDIRAPLFETALPLGASLAVDGTCLTVVAWRPGLVRLDVGPETLARTTLGILAAGGRVNLERPLRVGDSLGGHLVAGHVDAVGEILELSERGLALDVRIAAPPALLIYVIEKGSIAIDGISLTVNAVGPSSFSVSLIPHTRQHTTLGGKPAHAGVNLEVDLLGKYVAKLLAPHIGRLTRSGPRGLTLDKLKELGFVDQR